MEVTRYEEAPSYEAPKHHECYGLRLQGFDVTKTRTFWMGLSHFLPKGGAFEDANPVEKVYFVLEGEVTVIMADGEPTLENGTPATLRPTSRVPSRTVRTRPRRCW
jgi:glyoxylate utilization-related uncharacterized protein